MSKPEIFLVRQPFAPQGSISLSFIGELEERTDSKIVLKNMCKVYEVVVQDPNTKAQQVIHNVLHDPILTQGASEIFIQAGNIIKKVEPGSELNKYYEHALVEARAAAAGIILDPKRPSQATPLKAAPVSASAPGSEQVQ